MLALGRALGETMAVTFVIGNAHKISASLLAPGTTISATIANEFTEAVSDLYTSSLIALGLILFVITFFVLAIARFMLMRLERQAGADMALYDSRRRADTIVWGFAMPRRSSVSAGSSLSLSTLLCRASAACRWPCLRR